MKRTVSFNFAPMSEPNPDDLSAELRDVLHCGGLIEQTAELMVAIGPGRMHALCPDLTLTIASLERLMFAYTAELSSHLDVDDFAPSAAGLVPNELTSLPHAMASLEQVLNRLCADAKLRKSFPRPSGGMRSLLFYLSSTLTKLAQLLAETLHHEQTTHQSFVSRTRLVRAATTTASAAALVTAGTTNELLPRHPPPALVQGLRWTAANVQQLGGHVGLDVRLRLPLGVGDSGSGSKDGKANTVWLCAMGATTALAVHGLRKWSRIRRLRRRFADTQAALSTMMRLWILTMQIVQAEKTQRTRSFHTLFLPSTDLNTHPDNQPSSRHLVEKVPVPSAIAFWYDAHEYPAVSLFRRTMDIMYASAAVAGPTWDLLGKVPGCAVLGLSAVYYSCVAPLIGFPTAASHRACAELQQPSARFVRRAWGLANNPILVKIAQKIASFKGLKYQHRVEINGVRCFVYAASPPPEHARPGSSAADWEGWANHVLFYIHGGGFVAFLHAADLSALTVWARQTNAVIVVPEYGLAPEHVFPTALEQLQSVYQAVVNEGVLTFGAAKPERVNMVGESAGGNLAAGLVVRLVVADLDEQAKLEQAEPLPPPSATSSANKVRHGTASTARHRNRLRLPDGLLLAYPALNLSPAPSPARAVHNFDPVLPIGIMYAIQSMYSPDELQAAPHAEPSLSPYHTPDYILERFPRTHLMAGGFDPLLDDSQDFHTRLSHAGVQASIEIYHGLPHGFCGLVDVVPAAAHAVEKAGHFLKRCYAR